MMIRGNHEDKTVFSLKKCYYYRVYFYRNLVWRVFLVSRVSVKEYFTKQLFFRLVCAFNLKSLKC